MPWVFKISHHEPVKDANGKKIGRQKVVLTDKNGNEKPGAYVEWMDAKGTVWAERVPVYLTGKLKGRPKSTFHGALGPDRKPNANSKADADAQRKAKARERRSQNLIENTRKAYSLIKKTNLHKSTDERLKELIEHERKKNMRLLKKDREKIQNMEEEAAVRRVKRRLQAKGLKVYSAAKGRKNLNKIASYAGPVRSQMEKELAKIRNRGK